MGWVPLARRLAGLLTPVSGLLWVSAFDDDESNGAIAHRIALFKR